MFDIQVYHLCVSRISQMEWFLEKLRLEGELETLAWLESQQRKDGTTSSTSISVSISAVSEQVKITNKNSN